MNNNNTELTDDKIHIGKFSHEFARYLSSTRTNMYYHYIQLIDDVLESNITNDEKVSKMRTISNNYHINYGFKTWDRKVQSIFDLLRINDDCALQI